MLTDTSTMAPMVEKLALWVPLSDTDRTALLKLPHHNKVLSAHAYIVREGDRPKYSCLLLSGFAYRHKVAGTGGRQIFSIHMAGDVVDLHNSLLRHADHNVQTLTSAHVALIPIEAIKQIAFDYPAIGQAMWYETLADASIFREWTLNVGRRDARSRTAHMLCEFALRLEVAGLAKGGKYELPMTQEQLADALALTNVHVNRMLKTLEREGLIKREQRAVEILNFDRLASVGDFDPAYLHLDHLPPIHVSAQKA